MRFIRFLFVVFFFYIHGTYAPSMKGKTYTYLALGDSYTIGESVPVYESFPYQTVQLLRKAGYDFNAAEIVAKTGWTTDELEAGIQHTKLQNQYDFVTLLIGVNNQFRGRPVEEYARQFESLLKQAISLANDKPEHVFVLSIPDWGVTPFAEGRNRKQIADGIDAFNEINRKIALQYQVGYIDITPYTREATADTSLLTHDQLHPSGKDYTRWANILVSAIRHKLD